jgi:hypothetical protein
MALALQVPWVSHWLLCWPCRTLLPYNPHLPTQQVLSSIWLGVLSYELLGVQGLWLRLAGGSCARGQTHVCY